MTIERTATLSDLAQDADAILAEVAETGGPLTITEHGEVKAVLQSAAAFHETQETIAFLQLVLMGMEDIAAGHLIPADEVMERLRARGRAVAAE